MRYRWYNDIVMMKMADENDYEEYIIINIIIVIFIIIPHGI